MALAVAGALVLAGCDLNENADLENGRALFSDNCARCHTLEQAGSTADIGPNLDNAFLAARESGMDQDTFEGVVEYQISDPRPADPEDVDVYMPRDLVEGQDKTDVAAYVASVAGTGQKPPKAPGGPGGQIFYANGCQSCHTLAAAKATGVTGPNLDDNLPGMSKAEIEKSITDPDATIVKGYDSGVMPSDFGTSIDSADLKVLVDFLYDSTNGK